jgi:DNA-directed RNA polymerase specialized sigma24 family protein
VVALDEALAKLEAHAKAKADVVKLRYFTGLTIEETAAVLEKESGGRKRVRGSGVILFLWGGYGKHPWGA